MLCIRNNKIDFPKGKMIACKNSQLIKVFFYTEFQALWKDKAFFCECLRCALADENKFHMFLDHFQFSLEVDLYKLVVMELLEMDKPILLQDYLVFLKGFTITKYKSVLQTILMQNSKILKEACHRENSEFIKVSLLTYTVSEDEYGPLTK